MNTDYNGKNKFKSSNVIRSFQYAIQGITHTLMKERNMQIHVSISVIVVFVSFILKLSAIEWLFILFAIGGVFALELVNTAIERIVDLVTKEYHPLAKQAKDIAAGAAFIYSILSVIVGIIIFLPKIL
ncbi:diacylglycerol kinase family protein [Robertmurraya kyonggiensis]|uniref:Diacylglycerol kinase family protein n=1 Tax=Robertmurraya kyonggiensis TaxID=1037680 RepID=A0A4U1DBH9_9BACI|nr:diacylglycerol kinase family protein [Robertmurraya kyonggiensis]TKC19951.1 diacylglycerol kinase family protein [Robertmurraya kyonggiensis]